MIFTWYTGPPHQRSWAVRYGHYTWPSWCEWYVPGTWPGAWEDAETNRPSST